jgi:hypothetical protein
VTGRRTIGAAVARAPGVAAIRRGGVPCDRAAVIRSTAAPVFGTIDPQREERAMKSTPAALAVLPALALCGCASTVDPPVPSRFVLAQLEPEAVQGGTALVPLDPGQRRYLVVVGDEQGQTVTERLSVEKNDTCAPYRVRRPRPRIERLAVNEAGDIVLEAIVDLDHDVLVRFDPPLPRVPARLEPGFTRTTKSRATVRPRSDPETIKHRGDVTETLSYEGRMRIRTPAGPFDTVHLHSHMTTHFSVASVSVVNDRYLAPGTGLVAEGFTDKVNVFLFIGWSHTYVMLLESTTTDGTDQGQGG